MIPLSIHVKKSKSPIITLGNYFGLYLRLDSSAMCLVFSWMVTYSSIHLLAICKRSVISAYSVLRPIIDDIKKLVGYQFNANAEINSIFKGTRACATALVDSKNQHQHITTVVNAWQALRRQNFRLGVNSFSF